MRGRGDGEARVDELAANAVEIGRSRVDFDEVTRDAHIVRTRVNRYKGEFLSIGALGFEGEFPLQVTISYCGNDLGNAADLTSKIASHRVHIIC